MSIDSKSVIIETAFNQNSLEQQKYAEECLEDSKNRGEIPFCPQLDCSSLNMSQRQRNKKSKDYREEHGHEVILYTDLGYTFNMIEPRNEAKEQGRSIEERSLSN